jgi:hypothetical protein
MSTATVNTELNSGKDKSPTNSNIINTLKRNNLYWISQTSGWSLFVIVNIIKNTIGLTFR